MCPSSSSLESFSEAMDVAVRALSISLIEASPAPPADEASEDVSDPSGDFRLSFCPLNGVKGQNLLLLVCAMM